MDKVVLITGASTGFGRVTAELLGRRGYRVFATMRDGGTKRDRSRGVGGDRPERALGLDVLELDVTDDASVERAFRSSLAGRAN